MKIISSVKDIGIYHLQLTLRDFNKNSMTTIYDIDLEITEKLDNDVIDESLASKYL